MNDATAVPIECAVFDLDDTLFLERDYALSGFDAVGEWVQAKFGIDGFAAAAWGCSNEEYEGPPSMKRWRSVGPRPMPMWCARIVDVYRSHRPAIELLPDARRALAELAGVPLAVVTDGPVPSQRAKADAHGVRPLVARSRSSPASSVPASGSRIPGPSRRWNDSPGFVVPAAPTLPTIPQRTSWDRSRCTGEPCECVGRARCTRIERAMATSTSKCSISRALPEWLGV